MRLLRLLPLFLILAALAVAWLLGVRQVLSWSTLAEHRATLEQTVETHLRLAAGAYVAVYVAAVALSVPGAAVLTVTGGLLFGTIGGTALAVIGASLGALVPFLAARSAFAGVMETRAGAMLARIRPGLERDGFSYLLALRLVPAFPFWLVNLAPGLVGMRLAPYAAATLIGIIPGTLVFASIGAGLDHVMKAGGAPDLATMVSAPILAPLAGLAALSLLPVGLRWWRRRGSI